MSRRLVVLALVAGLGCTARALPQVVYAGSGGLEDPGFNLCWVEPEKANVHGLWSSLFLPALDLEPAGRYLYAASDHLRRLDLVGGSRATMGPLALPGGAPILMLSLSFAPDGRLLGCSNQASDPAGVPRLYDIDPDTGALTYLADAPVALFALEFAADGTLFGGFNQLLEIDPDTGTVLANHGGLGAGLFSMDDLDIDAAGTMRMVGVQVVVNPDGSIGATTRIARLDPSAAPGAIATIEAELEHAQLVSLALSDLDLVCLGDLDDDRTVSFGDLVVLLGAWGRCDGCVGDLDGDGIVGTTDLVQLLSKWGGCPY